MPGPAAVLAVPADRERLEARALCPALDGAVVVGSRQRIPEVKAVAVVFGAIDPTAARRPVRPSVGRP